MPNLIVNAGAENGLTGWTTLEGAAAVIKYGTSGYPTSTSPGPSDRAVNFFAGGDVARSRVTQTIVLPNQTDIDAGQVRFDFGGWLGGYSTQDDGVRLSAEFLDVNGQPLGVIVLGPVTAGERSNTTGMVQRRATGIVPPGSRTARVLLLFTRAGGTSNDGYADSLWLTLSTDRNLVINGGAENGLNSWTNVEGLPVIIAYGASGYPTPTGPGPADRGTSFFTGGTSARSRMTQDITLPYPGQIDAGTVTYAAGVWLGGWKNQADSAQVTIDLRNASGQTLKSIVLGPVTAAQRNNVTGLFERIANGTVPAGSRTARVEVLFVRTGGSSNDGYADNISLQLELN